MGYHRTSLYTCEHSVPQKARRRPGVSTCIPFRALKYVSPSRGAADNEGRKPTGENVERARFCGQRPRPRHDESLPTHFHYCSRTPPSSREQKDALLRDISYLAFLTSTFPHVHTCAVYIRCFVQSRVCSKTTFKSPRAESSIVAHS